MMTDEKILKPCPFCGEVATFTDVIEEDYGRYYEMRIECQGLYCDTTMAEEFDYVVYRKLGQAEADNNLKNSLAKKWNTRAPQSALDWKANVRRCHSDFVRLGWPTLGEFIDYLIKHGLCPLPLSQNREHSEGKGGKGD